MMGLVTSIMVGQRRREGNTGDEMQVVRVNHLQNEIDVLWLSGPEKGRTLTYVEGWVYCRTKAIEVSQ